MRVFGEIGAEGGVASVTTSACTMTFAVVSWPPFVVATTISCEPRCEISSAVAEATALAIAAASSAAGAVADTTSIVVVGLTEAVTRPASSGAVVGDVEILGGPAQHLGAGGQTRVSVHPLLGGESAGHSPHRVDADEDGGLRLIDRGSCLGDAESDQCPDQWRQDHEHPGSAQDPPVVVERQSCLPIRSVMPVVIFALPPPTPGAALAGMARCRSRAARSGGRRHRAHRVGGCQVRRIHRDGLEGRDAGLRDQRVVGSPVLLTFSEEFFTQLLPGAQTRVHDLDMSAAALDESAGHVVDAHLSHPCRE